MSPWWSGNSHHQAEKATEPGCLPSPSQSSPPFTLPELSAVPRRTCSSECHVVEHIHKSTSWNHRNIFFLNDRHTPPLIPGMGGDTDVKVLLRSTSFYYWENKTMKATDSLSQLTLPPPITNVLLGSIQLHGTTAGISWTGTPSPTAFPHGIGA